MKRHRKYIPLQSKLAAALAMLLPQQQRDQLRRDRVPASSVVRLFTADHIRLHAWTQDDHWSNLDMRVRGPELKAKDSADTSRAFKALRIDADNAEHKRRMAQKWLIPARKMEELQGRHWPRRPFPKRRKPNEKSA